MDGWVEIKMDKKDEEEIMIRATNDRKIRRAKIAQFLKWDGALKKKES